MMTIEQARVKAAEVNAAIAGGANPAQAKRAHKAELTYAELFAEYIKRHQGANRPNPTTLEGYEQRFRQYLEKPLGAKKLSQLTRADFAKIHNAITVAGHAAVANRVLAIASSVFSWAISVSLHEHNPAKGIKKNSLESRERFLQENELPRFFQALAEEPNDTLRDYFLFSLLTGARKANVLGMRWPDVNFERKEWRIPTTKNGTSQTVTLTAEVIEILRNRQGCDATWVFPSTGVTGHLVEPKKAWSRLLERAGFNDLRIHDLRRSLGSWQALTGSSLLVIGKSLNHKSLNSTLIYARLNLNPVRKSVERATDAMLTAGGVKESGETIS